MVGIELSPLLILILSPTIVVVGMELSPPHYQIPIANLNHNPNLNPDLKY